MSFKDNIRKLHICIALPFIVLFTATIITIFFLESYNVSRTMDERISRQSADIAKTLARSEFILNPRYLQKLREVLDGEIFVLDDAGRVVVSSLSVNFTHQLKRYLGGGEVAALLSGRKESLVKDIDQDGNSYLLVCRKLELSSSKRNMVVVLATSLADIAYVKSRISGRLFMTGIIGFSLVTILALYLASSITRPLRNLIGVTEEISQGNFDRRAGVPKIYELSKLAQSVNVMADKLKQYEMELVRSSQLAAAGKIAGAVAHEIRNPLSSMKMTVQLLRDRVAKDASDQKMIQIVLNEIGRLERTVNELNERVKPSNNQLESVDLNGTLQEVIEMASGKLAHRKIRVDTMFDQKLPALNLDKDKIKQVFWNVILNAAESMPEGGTIRISTKYETSGKIEIVVEDEGAGIPADISGKIFEPFFTTKASGLGLGLSTSKRIIESHGGELKIENKEAGGTKASVILPVPHGGIHSSIIPD